MKIDENKYLYSKKLTFGDFKKNIGIATLWTETSYISSLIPNNVYAVIGNFYDVFNGLEPLVRNCLYNPTIRYILLVGDDRSGSKNTLVSFFKYGIANNQVINTDVPFTDDIPLSDINELREGIELIDLTEKMDLNNKENVREVILNTISSLTPKGPFAESRTYKFTEKKVSVFPSSNTVFTVEGDFIYDVWRRLCHTIMTYGNETTMTNDCSSIVKECINLITIIKKENPDEPKIDGLKFSEQKLYEYYKSFCNDYCPPGIAYTYGSRFGYQFDELLEILKEDRSSKFAYATTWKEGDITGAVPPCVISIHLYIQNNILYLTAYIRSNDMFRAWPLNAFGLRKIQYDYAKKLNCMIGETVINSSSAQIYSENWKECELLCNKKIIFNNAHNYKLISQKNKITCIINNKVIEGFSAREINDRINENFIFSNTYSAFQRAGDLIKMEYENLKN